MKDYNKNNVELAKDLRKNMTKEERKLWYEFLCNYSVRFQRQKPVLNYIADFYCAKRKLIIEIDGSGHYTTEKEEYDKTRTLQLEEKGFTVLRFTNIQINNSFNQVCEYINKYIKGELN